MSVTMHSDALTNQIDGWSLRDSAISHVPLNFGPELSSPALNQLIRAMWDCKSPPLGWYLQRGACAHYVMLYNYTISLASGPRAAVADQESWSATAARGPQARGLPAEMKACAAVLFFQILGVCWSSVCAVEDCWKCLRQNKVGMTEREKC